MLGSCMRCCCIREHIVIGLIVVGDVVAQQEDRTIAWATRNRGESDVNHIVTQSSTVWPTTRLTRGGIAGEQAETIAALPN